MIIAARELLQYDKNNINYYINFPKLYTKKESDILKIDMVEEINNIIFDDILIFINIIEDEYLQEDSQGITVNTLTEFTENFNFFNVISISIEFSQLMEIFDISYIKAYNYDLDLKREIKIRDLFKKGVDYASILKLYINNQLEKIIKELHIEEKIDLHELIDDYLCIDCESIFYFTEDYLVLPFASFELNKDIANLVEFKIPFNTIYPYLSRYAVKKIVHKVIL